jgi:hypothetical protein
VREEGDAMARPRRALALGVVTVAVILSSDRAGATARQNPGDVERPVATADPRVRTEDPVVSALIQQATDLSPTFRRLVGAIQATDGVVYVQRGRCGHYVRACLPFWMTVAGPNRILRVVLDDRKTDGDEMEAMALLAHELRHALEVLGEPSIKTGSGMYHFYRRGPSIRGETFETHAAINTGNAVYRELKRPPGQRK